MSRYYHFEPIGKLQPAHNQGLLIVQRMIESIIYTLGGTLLQLLASNKGNRLVITFEPHPADNETIRYVYYMEPQDLADDERRN